MKMRLHESEKVLKETKSISSQTIGDLQGNQHRPIAQQNSYLNTQCLGTQVCRKFQNKEVVCIAQIKE
jgi:hypothetical protein